MRILVLGLALTACKPLPPAGNVPADLAEALPRPVFLLDDAGAAAYAQAVVRMGSSLERSGTEGLAALTAHAMAEGGAGDRDPDAVRDQLYRWGTGIQVVVDDELVSFRLACPVQVAAPCLDLLADVVTAPRFDPATVERLRDEALHALGDGLRSDEERLAQWALEALLYEGHPYAYPPAGRAGAVELLDADDVAAFHAKHVVRATTVVGVAGAATHDDALAFVERFRALPSDLAPDAPLMPPSSEHAADLLGVETGSGVVGYRFGAVHDVTRDHPDHAALALGFAALGFHRQSFGQLFRELRGRRGLNYGTYAYAEPFVQRPGEAMPEQGIVRRQPYWHLWVRPVAQENAAFALKLARAELADTVANGPDPERFEAVKAWLTGTVPLMARDPGRRLAFALEAMASGTPDLLETLPAKLEALTHAEVTAALQRHIDPEAAVVVAVGGGLADVVDALQGDDPTVITYADGLTPGADQQARDAEVAAQPFPIGADRTVVRDVEGLFD